eukprot:Hpha_TRINITY_DN12491_c0_g1::TRINITY_DN12491_c0_g1_i1::g.42996::m.42996
MPSAHEAKRYGGYVKEKAAIARTKVTGDEIERAVLKCTSHAAKAPNEKHLSRLLATTDFTPDEAARIAASLERRMHDHEWVVVGKALTTVHALMRSAASDHLRVAILRRQSLFLVQAMKLGGVGCDREEANNADFARRYARYLEERSATTVHGGLSHSIENTAQCGEELTRMPMVASLQTATGLVRQMRAAADIGFDPEWAENPVTAQGLRMCAQDARLLYLLTSRQFLLMLDSLERMSSSERNAGITFFEEFDAASRRLQGMFDKLSTYRGGSAMSRLVAESAPQLRLIPQHDAEVIRATLRSGVPRPSAEEEIELADIPTDVIPLVTLPSGELSVGPAAAARAT